MKPPYLSRVAKGGLLGVTLALSACASNRDAVPTPALATAHTAILEAEAAGAMQATPVELLEARQKLVRAQAAVADEEYVHARRLAERAEADALLAERRTRAMKTQRAAAELARSNELLQRESQRALSR